MDVKEAVSKAKAHMQQLFAAESLTHLGLEEVEFDDSNNEWLVTVGFSRPWDYRGGDLAAVVAPFGSPHRSYKIVRINDSTQEVLSVKNRAVDDARNSS